jgi:uncharacterized protein
VTAFGIWGRTHNRPSILVLYSSPLKVLVKNQTRGSVLGKAVDVADTSSKRRTGLLKHERLDNGTGLWIVPCESVHTFFMKFAIDLVYLDKGRKVRKVRNAVPPWRLSACLAAHSVLELPAGTASETGTQVGDELAIDKLDAADGKA